MIRYASAFTFLALSVTVAACDSGPAPAPGATAPAATSKPAETKPASTAATSVAKPAPAAGDKKKLPSKTAGKKEDGAAKKGGSGADEKPSDKSHKASDKTVNATDRKKVESAGDPCEQLPDGVAECHGDVLWVCDDKDLWAIDCKALMTSAYPDLFSTGTCYETTTITDCMGAGVAEDGFVDFCTSDLSVCCDDGGECYVFH